MVGGRCGVPLGGGGRPKRGTLSTACVVGQRKGGSKGNSKGEVLRVLTMKVATVFDAWLDRSSIGLPFFATGCLLMASAAVAASIPDELWEQGGADGDQQVPPAGKES